MVFGLEGTSPPIHLRNWLTFKLCQVDFVYAYQATFQPGRAHLPLIKFRYNQQIYKEIVWKYRFYLHTQTLDKFRRQFQWGDHRLVTVAHPDIAVAHLFPLLFFSPFSLLLSPLFFLFPLFLFSSCFYCYDYL